jgi:hypothetical protein
MKSSPTIKSIATATEQRREQLRNMQLARRTARASCMPTLLFTPRIKCITEIFQRDDHRANITPREGST